MFFNEKSDFLKIQEDFCQAHYYIEGAMTNAFHCVSLFRSIAEDRAIIVYANEYDIMHLAYIEGVSPTGWWNI